MKTVIWKIGLALPVVCLPFAGCGAKPESDEEIPGAVWTDIYAPRGNLKWTDELGSAPLELDYQDFAGRGASGGNFVTIDPGITYQTMEGFGASDCWSGNFIGRYWAENVKQRMSDWLFSQDFDGEGSPVGIGLSEWRVNLGAGSWEQGMDSRIGTINYNADNMTGSWERRAESFLADIARPKGEEAPGLFKHPKSGILYNWEKQKGQQYFMEEARKRGVEAFVLFSNSPPVPWTINGFANAGSANAVLGRNGRLTPANRRGNLKPEHYADFAAYLADTAEYFTGKGYRIAYVSPVNEPGWEWNEDKQEGSPWTVAEIAELVRAISAAIQERPSIAADTSSLETIKATGTKVLAPESPSWQHAYGPHNGGNCDNHFANLYNANHASYIGGLPATIPLIYAGHTYFTHGTDGDMLNHRSSVKNNVPVVPDGHGGELKIYSTEWCALDLGTGVPSAGNANYFDIALFMAKLAHVDIAVLGSCTFSFWTAMDMERGGKSRYSLIGYSPGTSDYDLSSYRRFPVYSSGAIKSQPTLWALGNYSLFIRPGFRRISLEGDGIDLSGGSAAALEGLMGTAYKSPPGFKDKDGNAADRIVTVYVNFSREPRRLMARFADGREPRLIRGFLTDEANTGNNGGLGLRRQPEASRTGVIDIPGRSIYTVVYDF